MITFVEDLRRILGLETSPIAVIIDKDRNIS